LIAAVLLVGLTIGCSAVAASIPPETTPGRNLVMELWEISLVRIVLVAAALWSLACFLPTARVAWVRFKHGQPNVSLARVPSPGRTIRRRDVIRAEDPIAYWTGWSEWRYTWALYHSRK
jgi:hypothetical protein